MIKNILPLIENNARPNVDLASYGSRDSYIHNAYVEVYKGSQDKSQQVFAIKRPGMNNLPTSFPTYGEGSGLGCFTSQNLTTTNVFYGVSRGALLDIYHFNDSSTTPVYSGLNQATNYPQIKFSNVGLPDDTYNVVVTNGPTILLGKTSASMYYFSPGSPSCPWAFTAQLTHAVYLNNRIFVGNSTDGQIYQSALGNFRSYSASEFIVAEAYGGRLVDLARYNNYIVAFKEYSTEFFEDVANQNGSVLGRVQQAVQQVGCVNPATICDTGGGELIWMTNDESGRRRIQKLNNSFQLEDLTDNFLGKYLELVTSYDGSFAYMLNTNGHQFYVLSLASTYYPTASLTDFTNITFVYDLNNKIWYNWYSEATGTTPTPVGVFDYRTLGRWLVSGSAKSKFGTTYVQCLNTGELRQLDDAYTTDYYRASGIDTSRIITYKLRFSGIDCDTFNRKFLNSITILTDLYSYANYSFTVGWYTQDGALGNARTVTGNYLYPYEYTSWAFGSFKRAALEITNTQSASLRISGIILNYDVGEGYGIS